MRMLIFIVNKSQYLLIDTYIFGIGRNKLKSFSFCTVCGRYIVQYIEKIRCWEILLIFISWFAHTYYRRLDVLYCRYMSFPMNHIINLWSGRLKKNDNITLMCNSFLQSIKKLKHQRYYIIVHTSLNLKNI